MGGGGDAPKVSNPVITSATDAAAKARQSQLTALRRQGMQSTLLSQQQMSSGTGNVGYRTLLGGA